MAGLATQVNIGPTDAAIGISQALPAASNNVTTAAIDLQAVGPFSDAWRLGRFAVKFPALPENNTGAGITVALQAAAPSLTLSPIAPALPVAGAFAAPICAQTITLASIAQTGTAAGTYYFTPAFDSAGSTFQFYNFVITVPAGVVTVGELITIQWEYA